MAQRQATNRLLKEHQRLLADPIELIEATPNERNILEWHYLITGPPDTPYHGGLYHGKVIFPPDYPYKPPRIEMVTPNGRFSPRTRLCLSISDYHPELWKAVWNVGSILTGLLSFMVSNEPATGCVISTEKTKRELAARSIHWNLTSNPEFCENFKSRAEELRRQLGLSALPTNTVNIRGEQQAQGQCRGPQLLQNQAAAVQRPRTVKPLPRKNKLNTASTAIEIDIDSTPVCGVKRPLLTEHITLDDDDDDMEIQVVKVRKTA